MSTQRAARFTGHQSIAYRLVYVFRADDRPGYVLMFMQTLHGQVYSRVSLLSRVVNV